MHKYLPTPVFQVPGTPSIGSAIVCTNARNEQLTLDNALDAVALKATHRTDSPEDLHPISSSDNSRSFVDNNTVRSGPYTKTDNVSKSGDTKQRLVKTQVDLYIWNNKPYDIGGEAFAYDTQGKLTEPNADLALGKTNLPVKTDVTFVEHDKNGLVTSAYTIPYTYTISPTCEIKEVSK